MALLRLILRANIEATPAYDPLGALKTPVTKDMRFMGEGMDEIPDDR